MTHIVKRKAIFLALSVALVWGAVIGSFAQAPSPAPGQARFDATRPTSQDPPYSAAVMMLMSRSRAAPSNGITIILLP